MRIRPYSLPDNSDIWRMLEPVFRAGDTYAIDPQITREDAIAYWTGADAGAFVVEGENGALGTYYIKTNAQGGGAHVCNCGFVTASDAGGKGVARMMLTDALEREKALGYKAVQFNFVLSHNIRAVDIWHRRAPARRNLPAWTT